MKQEIIQMSDVVKKQKDEPKGFWWFMFDMAIKCGTVAAILWVAKCSFSG